MMDTMQAMTLDQIQEEITQCYARLRLLENQRDTLIASECDGLIRAVNPEWFYGMELAVIPEVMDYQNIRRYQQVYLTKAFPSGDMQVSTRARPGGGYWDMPRDTVARMRAAWLVINKEAKP